MNRKALSTRNAHKKYESSVSNSFQIKTRKNFHKITALFQWKKNKNVIRLKFNFTLTQLCLNNTYIL